MFGGSGKQPFLYRMYWGSLPGAAYGGEKTVVSTVSAENGAGKLLWFWRSCTRSL